MPIHLPPLSRREFLKRTLVAGAGALLGPRLWAAAAAADPHTWALLSDTHVSAERTKVLRGVNVADNFSAAVGEVAAWPQQPAGALVTGDCAFVQGEAADYAAFAALLQPVRTAPMPVHLVLGNHDHRDHLRAAFASETAPHGPPANRRVALVRAARANWFLLDSLDQTNVTSGLLGDEQRAWLAKALDAHADKPAIVVAHHNLEGPALKPTGLRDTDELLEILAPRRHVKAYVFGHTHRWEVKPHASGIHLINLPPVAYVFAKGKPSGWVLATLAADGIRLRLNCLDHAHTAHGETVDLPWRSV